jgi:hypothetical protein
MGNTKRVFWKIHAANPQWWHNFRSFDELVGWQKYWRWDGFEAVATRGPRGGWWCLSMTVFGWTVLYSDYWHLPGYGLTRGDVSL